MDHLAVGPRHPTLCQREHDGEQDDGVDGLEQEAQAQDLQRRDEHDDVERQVGLVNGNARDVEYDGGETRQRTCHNLVRQEKAGPSYGVEHQAQGDAEVVQHLVFHVLPTIEKVFYRF